MSLFYTLGHDGYENECARYVISKLFAWGIVERDEVDCPAYLTWVKR